MSKEDIYFAFDFSMNKPACTVYYQKSFNFWFWPLKLPKKHCDEYAKYGVHVTSRNLPTIDTKKTETSQLALIHTIRSTDLANLIISQLDEYYHLNERNDYSLYVCSEGLSFGSSGDATLNLATYKGVLMSKIYEHYGDNLKRMFTYSPNTIKSTAGCAVKEKRNDKKNMILAFAAENLKNPFRVAVADGTFIAKTNYVVGVDDLVDSYWAMKTMMIKENLIR